ncbi:NHLM bacteriocin system secretion protein [Fulvimarina manganoxydans]|uniref:NHLM bacteriocin system secretion protein n=1 Tax=Fulvimarina manganoxydans TaxID=937218 RepID=A0A1W2D3S6_9HYPH|nr:NHLP bacteriocin system secretion protein [Fulvimarina manganoxydans]SMC91846.1 NHLM bacteriocin system secretion protein [Fulvimarina manganoxydans]
MSIFRQEALKRLSSPERLDEALVAAAPRHWIAYGAATAVVAAAVAWGFLGSVPTRISADGILLSHDSEIFSAAAEGNGQLMEFLVRVGSRVEKGQPVALLKQDVSEAQLVRAKDALAHAEGRLEELQRQRNKNIAHNEAFDAKRRKGIAEKLANGKHRADVLQERLVGMRGLLRRGYIEKIRVAEVENELAKVREQMSEFRYAGLDIDVAASRLREDWRKQVVAQQKEVEAARDKVEDLKQLVKLTHTVDAPVTGVVTEVSASLGDVVAAGTPVVRIAQTGSNEDALLFVSPREGKRIDEGYAVHVEPSVVKKEEVGTILATVESVSELPMSSSAIQAMLHNERLVQDFSRDGPPIVVRADLTRDPSTPSGFAWTGGTGPAFEVETGTLVAATITVREEAPVTLILPFLRAMLGGRP